MAIIYIDNKPYEVENGQNLLHAGLSLKFNIPYFCWHPAMGSVGACRQCAVKQFKDEHDTRGRLVMACMTVAADGTRISIDDPEAVAFRASVIEWLMINHPHDCPVCDEGGECHLQDMTLMTGHTYRRYSFAKRTYRNQYLGPFINHEMNRCIQCYRCVRYYRDYAGGRDFDVFGVHDRVYFGRHEDGVLENEFSGNLAEICPTGVFTDKTLDQHYTRKWDMQTAPSICFHCSVGCNTIPAERYGMLRRIQNRYHSEVNGYFLCDRGRFGYEFVNSDQRLRQPLLRRTAGSSPEAVSREAALEHLAPLLARPERVIGIGSPRASLEANFALQAMVGPKRFYRGVSAPESRLVDCVLQILRQGPAATPSLREVKEADAVLVLGEDVTNVAPVLALALRQSIHQKPKAIAGKLGIPEWHDAAVREAIRHEEKSPLIIATPAATKLDEVASLTYRAASDDLARLGQAVAALLGAAVPAVTGLSSEVRDLAQSIADALRQAERPLVVSGTSSGSEAVLQAAANVAWALGAKLALTVPECNSMGLGLLGGPPLDEALAALQGGQVDTVIILENDLYRRAAGADVQAALGAARHVIVIDHLATATTAQAELVLPAATFAESDGTLVNYEGRAQRFYQVFVPTGDIQESWRWLRDMRGGLDWRNLDDVVAALAEAHSQLAPVRDLAPPAGFRIAGERIARQPHRFSGRTAMVAHLTIHEPKPPDDPDSPLAFSMEGYIYQPPPPLVPRFWAPGWNSIQAVNKFQDEVGGPLRGGDPGRRLIEPATNGASAPYFGEAPPAFEPRQDELLLVPLYHIFGSEEQSALAPGIAELSPQPYLALHPAEAARLKMVAGQEVTLHVAGVAQRLRLRFDPSLPAGLAGLPAGLPGSPAVILPAWGQLSGEASL
ncbi:MAG: NADH-quinone oxidoreductase subunit NuoG [Anaerolineae bacterium]|nr:NADH-quinone oxidoreductase subunit NuoG [Anaerolineae bacterium]